MSNGIVNAFCAVMSERDNPSVLREELGNALAGPYASDIPYSLAYAAHAGTSFSPERRAEQVRAGYSQELEILYAELLKHADTLEKLVTLTEEFGRLRAGYRQRYTRYLSSQSRTFSTMIAGPSNFPVRQMEKRNRVVDARRTELLEFLPRAKDAILKKLHPEWRPIMSGDDNAVERLEDKIAKAEALQARMKAVNAAIRKYRKAGADAQVRAIVELGLSEGTALELLKPDYCGRIGFPSYEITNNNANIKRMKERLERVGANKAAEAVEIQGEHARFEDCPADNRVRLFFQGKPAEEVRSKLKHSGFRWSPTIGAWQAYRNWRTIPLAKELAGAETSGRG